MKGQWMIWLLVTGLAYVSGNVCDKSKVEGCYLDLSKYETEAFPLYGQGEAKLEDTCGNINASFECIQTYMHTCHENPECDDVCKELIMNLNGFYRNTGLRNLAAELCGEENEIQQKYLKSYECLESNLELYSECRNISQISWKYIDGIKNEGAIPARCCYFSWFHDCFMNITHEHCDEDATDYVSFGLLKLVGFVSEKLCESADITCSTPPLPPDVDDDEESNEGKKDESNKDKKDEPDKDEEIISDAKKEPNTRSSSIIACPVAGTVTLFYFILFVYLLTDQI